MNTKRILLILATGLFLAVAGCVEGNLDDADSPEVYLEVDITESPAISAQDQEGFCVITVTEWSATYTNVPKNSLATTSPFNDIEIISVTITYDFPDLDFPIESVERELPSPGTVAAAGSQSIKFEPILFQDLEFNMLGTSGILNLVIRYSIPSRNEVFTKTIGEVLMIEGCT